MSRLQLNNWNAHSHELERRNMDKLNGTFFAQVKRCDQCDVSKGDVQSFSATTEESDILIWFVSSDGATTKKHKLYEAPKWLRNHYADYVWKP